MNGFRSFSLHHYRGTVMRPLILFFLAWMVIVEIPVAVATSLPFPNADMGSGSMSGEAKLPPEVIDQYSRQELSTLPEKILAARSEQLRERLEKEPENPFLLHELGTVLYQQEMTKEAVALWAAAHGREENLAPPEVMAAVQKVFRLLASERSAEAKKLLTEVARKFADNPHFQLIAAEQAMRSRQWDAAEKAYKRAYELAPGLYVTALNLGRFYDFRGREAAKTEELLEKAMELAPDNVDIANSMGIFYFHRNKPEQALAEFRRARELSATAESPERRLAKLYMTEQNYRDADKWLQAALQTRLGEEEETAVHAARGDVLLRLGEKERAREEIVTALARGDQPPLVFALATIDEEVGKSTEAEKGYRRVLELQPDNPLAANNLAMLLIRNGGSAEEALQLSLRARQAIPSNLIIEATYGCALVETGSFAEAAAVLQPVVDTGGRGDAWASFCHARALAATKRTTEAKAQLRHLLELSPDFQRKTEVEQLLNTLQQPGK